MDSVDSMDSIEYGVVSQNSAIFISKQAGKGTSQSEFPMADHVSSFVHLSSLSLSDKGKWLGITSDIHPRSLKAPDSIPSQYT